MKRIVLVAVAAGLVAAPVPAAVAKPKPKPLPACVQYADPTGDSGAEGLTPLNDPALDITKVRFSTVDSAMVTQISLSKYVDRPTLGTGGRYQVTFNLDGKVVDIYWKNGPAREEEANAFYQQGVRVDGTFIHDGVAGSVKDNVVTLAVKLTMLKSAVGSKVDGARATEVEAYAWSSYVGTNLPWDTAAAPASGVVIGQLCK